MQAMQAWEREREQQYGVALFRIRYAVIETGSPHQPTRDVPYIIAIYNTYMRLHFPNYFIAVFNDCHFVKESN